RASIDPYVSIFFTGHAAADLYPLPLHDALPICAVAACRYPPRGRRGFGPRRMSSYGRQGGAEYVRAADASLLVSVQIETTEALAELGESLATPGLDGIVVGPYDLSFAMGKPGQFTDPEIRAALARIVMEA